MARDFTFSKYVQLINAISSSEYKVLKIADYIKHNSLPEKFIIIRHDVDLDPVYQLKFAILEREMGIHTSYYFRVNEKVFREDIIQKIYDLGHEVGYHYEVFTKAKGDISLALDIFREEQAVFAKKWKSETVCPHGGSFVENTDGYSLGDIIRLMPRLVSRKKVFSNYVNFDLWKNNKFDDFGLKGDAYKSFDFSDFLYLSDTGRSWNEKYKRLDKVKSEINPYFNVRSSDDIIDIINEGKAKKIYLLVHFEQWKDKFMDWVSWYVAQIIRRTGKRLVFGASS
jgi:hypothetical protein